MLLSGRKALRKAAALLLAFLTAVPSALPTLAVTDGVEPSYDEAYYVTTDYYGNLTDAAVVKSYILNGAQTVADYGDYTEVADLSRGSTPVTSEGKTTFDLAGSGLTHFYFQGKTEKPFAALPWTLAVRYSLNGVPSKAEDLAGKTGLVEIAVDAVPNEKASDYAKHNYTLEVAAVFNQDDILSLEAPGAQVQLVGNLRAVLFMALPGEEQHFVMRVGAENFSFGGLTVLMVPATLGQLSEIARLGEKKDELEENYRKLSGSLDDLLDSLDDVSANLTAAASGLDTLNDARKTVSDGKDAVYDKADALKDDLTAVSGALAPVTDDLAGASAALTDVKTALTAANSDVAALKDDLADVKETLEAVRTSKKDLETLFDDVKALADALRVIKAHNGDLHAVMGDVGKLQTALENLRENKKELDALVTGLTRAEIALENLRKSRKALDRLITDVNDMEGDLNTVHKALKAAGGTRISTISEVKPAGTEKLTTASGLYTVYKTCSGGEPMNVIGFMTAILTMNGTEDAANTAYALFQVYEDAHAETPAPHTTGAYRAGLAAFLEKIGVNPAEATPEQLAAGAPYGMAAYEEALKQATPLMTVFASCAGEDNTMDFGEYLEALAAVLKSRDPEADTKDIETLVDLYRDNPHTVERLIGEAGGISGALDGSVRDVNGKIGEVNKTITAANGLLAVLEKPTVNLTDSLKTLAEDVDPLHKLLDNSDTLVLALADLLGKAADLDDALDNADALLAVLADTSADAAKLDTAVDSADALVSTLITLADDLEALRPQLDNADGLLSLASGSADHITAVLNDADALYTALDDYEPKAQGALDTVTGLITAARTTVDDTAAFADSLENLMRSSGTKLDDGTEKSLRSLAGSLRAVASSLNKTKGIREAKETVQGIVEDTWHDYTGDVNNLLLMDANAAPESLTDPRNPSPTSIQILIRTQEIEESDSASDADAATRATETAETPKPSFWQRVAAMFTGIFSAIAGLFH